MTTPTLVDAAEQARSYLGHMPAMTDFEKEIVATLRAAIDREAERQEIIEGLVEAALISRNCLSDMLDRYDAMKEDDRG